MEKEREQLALPTRPDGPFSAPKASYKYTEDQGG
jgi:hypothetical protein